MTVLHKKVTMKTASVNSAIGWCVETLEHAIFIDIWTINMSNMAKNLLWAFRSNLHACFLINELSICIWNHAENGTLTLI